MKRNVSAILPIFLVTLSPLTLSAQQVQPSVFSAHATTPSPVVLKLATDPQEEELKPADAMSMSGMMLGIVGMLGGAAIASALKQDACVDSEDDACLSRYAFTGALIAGTAMVPLGVHLANQKRKGLVASLAASTLAGAAFYFATRAIPGEPVHIAPFLAAPVQMFTAIKIETRK